jgi:hypothetical protein
VSKLTQSFTVWLFGFDRWKKRLLQIAFDVFVTPFALLLAFFMRLTKAYLCRLDTYIGVLIAITAACFLGVLGFQVIGPAPSFVAR